MGQFKPMVKMETTEPSVILKLKKGGHVNMKKGGMAEGDHKKMAGGGAMEMLGMTPAFVGRPAVNAPVKSPGKPSMAKRRKAMQAKKPAMSKKPPMPMPEPKGMPMMPPMKKGGKAEMSKMKGLEKELKSHESKPASKGHKGLKTGGVAKANAGGYATGGVSNSNAGGFKDGGKTSKKAYATGGTVDSGKPVALKQGDKPIPAPKRQQNFSGTYKDGGEVAKKARGGAMPMRMGPKPAQTIRTAPIGTSMATRDMFASKGKRPSYKDGGNVGNKSLQKINEKQNAPAVKASKADVNLKYPETMNSPQKTPKLKC